MLLLLNIFQFGCRSISHQIVGSELSDTNISEQLPADEVHALMPSERFIKEYTDEGRIYHTTREDALESIFQNGFWPSRVDDPNFTNPEQDHGSGLWATKEPDFALASEDRRKGIYRTTLVLRIVPTQEFIVFDYSARKSHPFVQRLLTENNNSARCNGNLKEKYGVLFIINHINRPEVIVQDFASIQHARSKLKCLRILTRFICIR